MGSQAYNQKNVKQVKLALNLKTDADIIQYLESIPNMQGYIKALIRNDMKEEQNMTITEFVKTLWENSPYGTEPIDIETARIDLEHFAADGIELPEGITPESYMEAWNDLI